MFVVYYESTYGNGLIFCGVYHSFSSAKKVAEKVQGVVSSVTVKDTPEEM